MNLWHLLEHAAARCGEQSAVICQDRRISWRRLHARSRQLGRVLAALGVRPGQPVAVLSRNSLEYVEILFGLLRCGAVAVPLNWRLCAGDIARQCAHVGVGPLFYSREFEDRVPPVAGPVVCLDRPAAAADHEYERLFDLSGAQAPLPGLDDPSCILFTAGTTGTPKGVVLTHGNQLWNSLNYAAAYPLGSRDVELAPAPLFHIATLGRLYTYALCAATCVLMPRFDAAACLDLIARERVTGLTQAPTMYRMLADAARDGDARLQSVRRAITGAASMSPVERRQLRDLFPGAALYDLYGMTEAAPGLLILGPREFLRRPGCVGRPLLSVSARIVDGDGRPVSPGTVGELCCRGPNVMQGYYRSPDATAAALRGGWLHTGDMGWCDADGFFYISGRAKEVIISGGINVYPGDVERVLLEHPAVQDAAVFGIPDPVWGEVVAAAVVPRPGCRVTDAQIIADCGDRTAGFQRPRRIFRCGSIPRNAAHKVDRRALQQRYQGDCDAVSLF